MIRTGAGLLFLIFSYLLYVHVSPMQSHCDIDSKAYLERAELFYRTNSLAKQGEVQAPYFALGYPLVMGMVFKIFGDNKAVMVWAQVLLAIVMGFLIYSIAARLFNTTVAGIAILLFACNLGFLVFSQFILTEIVLIFFLILFVERLTAFLLDPRLSSVFSSGLALGASVIIKPAALYFPLLLLLLLFFISGPRCNKIIGVLLFTVGFLGPIGAYAVHNKLVFGFYDRGNLDQVNIYFWFFPHVLAQKYDTNSDIEREKLIRINNADPAFTPVKKLFWQELRDYPARFAFVWLKNVFKTCVGLYTTNLKVLIDSTVHGGDISFFRLQGTFLQKIHRYIIAGTQLQWVHIVGYAEAFWSVIRYLLCVLGFWGLITAKRWAITYFLGAYLFYFSMITGHDGCARFRMLFEFMLILLAAYGLWLVIDFVFKKKGLRHETYKNSISSWSSVYQ